MRTMSLHGLQLLRSASVLLCYALLRPILAVTGAPDIQAMSKPSRAGTSEPTSSAQSRDPSPGRSRARPGSMPVLQGRVRKLKGGADSQSPLSKRPVSVKASGTSVPTAASPSRLPGLDQILARSQRSSSSQSGRPTPSHSGVTSLRQQQQQQRHHPRGHSSSAHSSASGSRSSADHRSGRDPSPTSFGPGRRSVTLMVNDMDPISQTRTPTRTSGVPRRSSQAPGRSNPQIRREVQSGVRSEEPVRGRSSILASGLPNVQQAPKSPLRGFRRPASHDDLEHHSSSGGENSRGGSPSQVPSPASLDRHEQHSGSFKQFVPFPHAAPLTAQGPATASAGGHAAGAGSQVPRQSGGAHSGDSKAGISAGNTSAFARDMGLSGPPKSQLGDSHVFGSIAPGGLRMLPRSNRSRP